MSDEFRSILVGTSGLAVAGVAAFILTVARSGVVAGTHVLRSAVHTAMLAVALQAGHFVEETATGFPQRFLEALGLTPWSQRFYVWFNVAWLLVWAASSWGLAARLRVALFPLWFLGIACVVNGIAHPALALRTGGYFPGLITSPLVGVAGILLVRQLAKVSVLHGFPGVE